MGGRQRGRAQRVYEAAETTAAKIAATITRGYSR
jgi:hypothetical protein